MQKKWINWFVFLIVQIVFWQLIYRSTDICNFIFNHITLRYNSVVYLLSSKINFPIGEWFYSLLVIFFIIYLVRILRKGTIQFKFFRISKLLFFVYLTYNLVWGISYYKSSFKIEFDAKEIKPDVLKAIYCDEYFKAERLRNYLTNGTQNPLQFNLNEIDYFQDFNNNQELLNKEKWIQNYGLITIPIVKSANVSGLMNHIGILGYYNPFTIESNINRYNTDLKQSFTISHELAHQMGFASENEANFIAYFLGTHSKYREVQYATYFKSMYSILGSIVKYDPLFVKSQLDGMNKYIKADRAAEIKYYSQFDGKANDTFSAMNNQFLKANNQEGIVSYSKYVELLYWYKTKKAND